MENSQEQEINDEFLLQCVANYQPLYDKSHKGYKSIIQKENCWASVARSLQTPVSTVKSRYKALREKFRREIALEEKLSRSGAPSSARAVWPLLSFFKFLYKYKQEDCRNTTSNFETEDGEILEEILIEHDDSQTITEGESLSCQTPVSKKRKTENVSKTTEVQKIDNVLLDVSSAVKAINSQVRQKASSDKYDHFGQYLSLELKEMGEPNSSILMEEIQIKIIEFKRSLRLNIE